MTKPTRPKWPKLMTEEQRRNALTHLASLVDKERHEYPPCTGEDCQGETASPSTEAPALRPVAEKFAQRNREIEDGMWPPAPQPIERCSCAESIRLRAALEDIIEQCALSTSSFARKVAADARRALALEPEGTYESG